MYEGRKKITEGFKNKIFLIHYDEEESFMDKIEEEKNIRDENGLIDYNRLLRVIGFKDRDINDELVRKHFLAQDLGNLVKKLQNSINNPEKNKIQVGLINDGLKDLKEEIKLMSEQEKETENPNEIVNLVENILEFNRQQQGQRLKILTSSQMLSRLPISLAQLQAGNNTETLKNEIRQLSYSVYRSKKLTKQLYKSLVDII